jgi:hypothetical protein
VSEEKEYLAEVRLTTIYRGIVKAPSQGIASALAGSRLSELHDIGMHVETDVTEVAAEAAASAEQIDAFQRLLDKVPVPTVTLSPEQAEEYRAASGELDDVAPEVKHAAQPKRRRLAKNPDATSAG